MLWIKALHIVFVASWFAGLFYLPRIFVNLAMETDLVAANACWAWRASCTVSRHDLAVALVLGVAAGHTWHSEGPGQWLAACQADLVVLVIGYHHACGSLLKNSNTARTRAATSGSAGSTKCRCC
jgi:putative membrane protein